MGVPLGEASRRAADFVALFILGGGDNSRLHEEVEAIVANPAASDRRIRVVLGSHFHEVFESKIRLSSASSGTLSMGLWMSTERLEAAL